MPIARVEVRNIASLVDFSNEYEFKKRNLIFGTNGSGKSTLVGLLRQIDDCMSKEDPEVELALKEFITTRVSRERAHDHVEVSVDFNSARFHLSANPTTNSLTISDDNWDPVKVFDTEYTHRTFARTVKVDLTESAVTIGEESRELERAERALQGLEEQLASHNSTADDIVEETAREFRSQTDSQLNLNGLIDRDVLLSADCALERNEATIDQSRRLGSGEPDPLIDELSTRRVELPLDIDELSAKCTAEVQPPQITADAAKHLKAYTDFFRRGVDLFHATEDEASCPFCRRSWPEATETIALYQQFLQSTFNESREEIRNALTQLEQYQQRVMPYYDEVRDVEGAVRPVADRYSVDMSDWISPRYPVEEHMAVEELLEYKFDHMHESVGVHEQLLSLQRKCIEPIEANNFVITRLNEAIKLGRSTRRELNKQLANHFGRRMWEDNADLRRDIARISELIEEKKEEINRIKEELPPSDTLSRVFNRFATEMGLGEYFLDNNRRLHLRIDRPYDIADEGGRISSAQAKMLSLCHFFAETVSRSQQLRDLKQMVLVFDDPVDSADYLYFHSVVSMIESVDEILSDLFGQPLDFGQVFVFTHNSLLYERMAARWAEVKQMLRKHRAVTVVEKAPPVINTYAEYVGIVCHYYKEPETNSSERFMVGNVIRRILEILASFDSLGSNDINSYLRESGYRRLHVLVNHCSHESFERVVDPIPANDELKEACRETLQIIKDRHPTQFERIRSEHGIEV